MLKIAKSSFFLFLIGVAHPCVCSENITLSNFDAVIHTYGGIELLERVFNAVSMFFYGNGSSLDKTFHSLVIIALTVGFVTAIYTALNKDLDLKLLKNYLAPTILIMCLALTPRTKVTIQDHLIQSSPSTKIAIMSVDNVPLTLAVTSQVISTLSYHITDLLEKVMHRGDALYNWTGHIYAGNNFFKMQSSRGIDKTTETNLREFCRECAWRDLGLGLYSHESLSKAPNLLKFFKEKTSRIRMMPYQSEKGKEWKSCREVISSIEESLKKQGGVPKSQVEEELRSSLSEEQGLKFLMTKSEQTLEDLKNQKMFVETIKEEMPGTLNSFAAKRAEMIQKENQKLLGALGASSIVAMKNFFEAIILLMFPIILIMCLVSSSLKPMGSWLQFSCWINVWPLFYVIVNFLLTSLWALRKASLNLTNQGLSLQSFDGLMGLYDSMESVAAIAMAFIPFLSWALIKGGVSQLVHLSSALTAPAQAGASTAAIESVSGNYSLGNVSVGNTSGYNYDAFKQNFSPGLSQGALSVDQGSQSMSYLPSEGRLFVKQENSQLREGFSQTDTFSHSVQNQLQGSETAIMEQGKVFSKSVSESSNHAVGLMEAYSSSAQHGNNFSAQEMSGSQQTFQKLDNMSREYAKTNNVSYDQAVREQVEAGFNLKIVAGATASSQDGVSKSDGESLGSRGSQGESFVDLMQEASNYSQSELGSFMRSEDLRNHEDFSKSWNEASSSADQLRSAHSKQQTLSHLEGDLKSDNFTFHKNLDQQFVEHLSNKFEGDVGEVNRVLDLPSSHSEKQQHVDDFVDAYSSRPVPEVSIQDAYQGYEKRVSMSTHSLDDTHTAELSEAKLSDYESSGSGVQEQVRDLQSRASTGTVSDNRVHLDQHIDSLKNNIDIQPSDSSGRNEFGVMHYAKDELSSSKHLGKVVQKMGEGSKKVIAALDKNSVGRWINNALEVPSGYLASKVTSRPANNSQKHAQGNAVHLYGKQKRDK